MTRLRAQEWGEELEPSSPLPLHHQMTEILMSHLSCDMVSVGDFLPREKELADHFRISRNTVRRAYAELEADGWIERKAGRGTTLVRKPLGSMPARLVDPEQGLDQILDLFDDAHIKRTVTTDTYVPAEVATFLGYHGLTTIEEDGLVSGRLIGICTWWIQPTALRETCLLHPEEATETTSTQEEARGGLHQELSPISISTLVVSRRADRREAKAFESAARAPILEIHHQLEDANNHPIAYAILQWRADEIGLQLFPRRRELGQADLVPSE
jgi:DNA-binding GntR family transcriptional regulator